MELPNHYTLGTGETVTDETWRDFCASHPMLGSGQTRDVYALDSRTVLKVMRQYAEEGAGTNEDEAAKWCEVRHHPDSEYFAEVRAIGTGGWWMVMERAEDISYACLPYDLENYLCHAWRVWDLHDENLGTFATGLKIIDYAYPYGDEFEDL